MEAGIEMSLTFFDLPMVLPLLALVLARITGLFVTAPMLNSSVIAVRIKVYAALAVSLVVLPNLLTVPLVVTGWVNLVAGMATELALGAIFGFTLNLVFVGLQLGAHFISQQSGLAMAEMYNPAFDAQMDIVGNIYYWVVVMAFLALGGHRLLVSSILGTFSVVPPLGAAWPESITRLVLDVMGACFELALRVAWPALLALLLSELALGFVSRTMPQLNILVLGFPIRIIVGMGVVLLTMGAAVELSLSSAAPVLQALKQAISVLPGP